jgi:PAS domain S-box-containing protein
VSDRTTITTTRKERLTSLLAGIFVAALVLAFTANIDRYEVERFRQNARIEALRYASVIRARLEGALNARLHLAHGLAAYAKSHPDDIPDFAAFAEGLMLTDIPGIRSLQLAPDGVVKYVYPLHDNEAVLNHDLRADASRREAVERTIRERLFIIAGPVPLMQGGFGLIARYPLFLGEGGNQRFWGFATVVLDVEPILSEGGLQPPLDASYSAALRGKDGMPGEGTAFSGDPALFDGSPVTLDVSLPHGSWQLAVKPAKGWPTRSPNCELIWLAGLLLAALLGAATHARLYASANLRVKIARATAALKDSEEQFRRVAESATDAIVSVDDTGEVVFWNKAAEAIFQYAAAEAVGQSVNDLVLPPQYREGHPNRYFVTDLHANQRLGRVIATVAMRKDGTVFPAELTLSHWALGDRTYFTAIIRDTSERKAAEREQALLKERYFQAQKMEAIGTLASGAAHEFNNILNGLLAQAEAAMSVLPAESAAMPAMYEVLDSGWRAAEIVRQLLVFSEKEAEPSATTNPSRALEHLLSLLRSNLPVGIQLETSISPTERLLVIGHDQFCHLVWNLAMNGIRAMVPQKGTLTVSLTEVVGLDHSLLAPAEGKAGSEEVRLVLGDVSEGPHLRLTVADCGRGMDSDTLARAFEPFFTTENVGSGTGLGLSVVLGLVQSMGGAIAVSSRRDAGTTVEVYLPAAPE